MKLHQARRNVEVAAEMLADEAGRPGLPRQAQELYVQLRADISGSGEVAKEGDRIGKMLSEFESEIETFCRPVVDRSYRERKRKPRLWAGLLPK